MAGVNGVGCGRWSKATPTDACALMTDPDSSPPDSARRLAVIVIITCARSSNCCSRFHPTLQPLGCNQRQDNRSLTAAQLTSYLLGIYT